MLPVVEMKRYPYPIFGRGQASRAEPAIFERDDGMASNDRQLQRAHPAQSSSRRRHHLVVVHARYISAILIGKKSVEVRLSRIRKPPWGDVSTGDLLWLKPPSRPVSALAVAGCCRFEFAENGDAVRALLASVATQSAVEPTYFDDVVNQARYVSLIEIARIVTLNPIALQKRDQRAWVMLKGPLRPDMQI